MHEYFDYQNILMKYYVFFVEIDHCDEMIQFNKKNVFIIIEMSICFEIDVIIIIIKNKH